MYYLMLDWMVIGEHDNNIYYAYCAEAEKQEDALRLVFEDLRKKEKEALALCEKRGQDSITLQPFCISRYKWSVLLATDMTK